MRRCMFSCSAAGILLGVRSIFWWILYTYGMVGLYFLDCPTQPQTPTHRPVAAAAEEEEAQQQQ